MAERSENNECACFLGLYKMLVCFIHQKQIFRTGFSFKQAYKVDKYAINAKIETCKKMKREDIHNSLFSLAFMCINIFKFSVFTNNDLGMV